MRCYQLQPGAAIPCCERVSDTSAIQRNIPKLFMSTDHFIIILKQCVKTCSVLHDISKVSETMQFACVTTDRHSAQPMPSAQQAVVEPTLTERHRKVRKGLGVCSGVKTRLPHL
jgi:hypothetical protein